MKYDYFRIKLANEQVIGLRHELSKLKISVPTDEVYLLGGYLSSIIKLSYLEGAQYYHFAIIDCQRPLLHPVSNIGTGRDLVHEEWEPLSKTKFNILLSLINADGPFPVSSVKFDSFVYGEEMFWDVVDDVYQNKLVTNPYGGVMVLINGEDPDSRIYTTPFDPRV